MVFSFSPCTFCAVCSFVGEVEIETSPKNGVRFSSEKTSARKCAALAINCFDRERTRYTEKALGFSNRA